MKSNTYQFDTTGQTCCNLLYHVVRRPTTHTFPLVSARLLHLLKAQMWPRGARVEVRSSCVWWFWRCGMYMYVCIFCGIWKGSNQIWYWKNDWIMSFQTLEEIFHHRFWWLVHKEFNCHLQWVCMPFCMMEFFPKEQVQEARSDELRGQRGTVVEARGAKSEEQKDTRCFYFGKR